MHQSIHHYMTRDPRVVAPTDSLHRARQVMHATGIRHLPVLESEKVVGIVTDRDIQLIESCGRAVDTLPVSEAMTPEPFVVRPDAPLTSVARVMAERKYGSAVVVEDGRLVGIFSVVDALHALADLFSEQFAAPTCDRWGAIVPPRIEP
jgi:acetoin utilization protein AcuB